IVIFVAPTSFFIASKYPEKYLYRGVAGVGEALPFENESFDLVTTYQTLEHVSDVNRCIQEMLRVLKQEGILYVKAPDYNCFFEPHYRVPFLPKMNKKLASVYLKLIRRPLLGLQDLQWITEKEVIKFLEDSKYKLKIERTKDYRFFMRQRKIKELLPKLLQNMLIISFVNYIYETKAKLIKLAMIGRIENNIDLWITKVG
ncbi:MAG: methyltransferase domain-containing protein, partial [Nitrospinota bacterium]